MKPTTPFTCTWCGRTFRSRTGGGKPQRFCCAAHRSRFWRALRKWASRVFDAGLISIDDLRRPYNNVHAALDGGKAETCAIARLPIGRVSGDEQKPPLTVQGARALWSPRRDNSVPT
jgi:hypothetical protein